jgi:hypothetical protein
MLLSTNEEDVDPEVWVVMKEQKKNCSSSYLLLSNRERFCSMWACAVETWSNNFRLLRLRICSSKNSICLVEPVYLKLFVVVLDNNELRCHKCLNKFIANRMVCYNL